MRFPRHVKTFRGQIDPAPLAGIFFLLLIFLLLTALMRTPGSVIELPTATTGAGVDGPTAIVSVDASGQFFFESQLITAPALKTKLAGLVEKSREAITLVVLPDKGVPYGVIQNLTQLAEEAGIKKGLLGARIVTEEKSP